MAWAWVRSLVGIAGSNPAGSMDVCRECYVFFFRYRSLRRTNHLCLGVLPSVVSHWFVISKPLREGQALFGLEVFVGTYNDSASSLRHIPNPRQITGLLLFLSYYGDYVQGLGSLCMLVWRGKFPNSGYISTQLAMFQTFHSHKESADIHFHFFYYRAVW